MLPFPRHGKQSATMVGFGLFRFHLQLLKEEITVNLLGTRNEFHCLKLTGPVQDNGSPVTCHSIVQKASYSSGASMDSDGPTGSFYSLLLWEVCFSSLCSHI